MLSVGLHSPTGVQMKASPAGSRRKNGMRDAAAGSAFQAGRALERPSPAGVATAPQHHSTTLMLCQQGLWCCGLVAILEEDRSPKYSKVLKKYPGPRRTCSSRTVGASPRKTFLPGLAFQRKREHDKSLWNGGRQPVRQGLALIEEAFPPPPR